MNIPCDSGYANCPCVDLPFGNYSAEAPDRQIWFGWYFGNPLFRPRLGSNWRRSSCLGMCISDISQAQADLCAVLAGIQCLDDWGVPPLLPPVVTISGPPLRPGEPTGGVDIFYSMGVTGFRTCPDGTPFYYTIGPGLFFADSQELADRMAVSYANNLAATAIVCFGTLNPCACVGVEYTDTLVINQNQEINFEIVSGSLPPGLSLTKVTANRATISGTPAASGNYTFTVRATLTTGAFIQKEFTLYCLELSPGPVLPHGYYGINYTQQFFIGGGTPPYSIRFAGFPCGLPPATFALTDTFLMFGIPDTTGDFNFCIEVTDAAGCVCNFPLQLEIKGICSPDITTTEVCPTNPMLIVTRSVPADLYCAPPGTDQRQVDGQARNDLANAIADGLLAAGCNCVYYTNHANRTVQVLGGGGCTLNFQVFSATGPIPPPSIFGVSQAMGPVNFSVVYHTLGLGWLGGWLRIAPPYGPTWWWYYPGGGP